MARVMLVVLALTRFHFMLQLITILNRCHRFPGFVYHQARFSSDHKSIEIDVRPRKRSAAVCSRCHQPAPGYDQLPERRFEFIPFWGFFVFLLYAMRRGDCRRCGAVVVEEVPWGDGKHTLTRALHAVPGPLGTSPVPGKEPPKRFALPGRRFSMPHETRRSCPSPQEVPLVAASSQR